MSTFYRATAWDSHDKVVSMRIFVLPSGLACVVSWPAPDAGMRVFAAHGEASDEIEDALGFAVSVRDRMFANRVAVELEDGTRWNADWGELEAIALH